MAAPLRRDTLPENYSYGVCRDGRVFFIDDETRSTSWLHPCTGEPVNSGHMIRSDLPTCWEEGFTKEGASFFIDHNQRTTTFIHPVTGQISAENSDFRLQDHTGQHMLKQQPQSTTRPSSTISEASTAVTSSTLDTTSGSKGSKSSGRVHSFGKRDHAIKRNPSVPAVVRGWLYKQDSSGMRLWKRKWFVLADYCLFYYKDSREESVLGSIPLPSYTIAPVGPEDHISRKYAFKAEHTGMRTYYFSADTQEDMTGWVRAMNQAALMQTHTVKRDESDHPDQVNVSEKLKQQAVPQNNHINSYVIPEPEVIQSDGLLEEKQERFVGEVEIEVAPREMEPARGKSPASRTVEVEVLAPGSTPASQVPSRAPSRAVSTPPVLRNGTPIEQNGMPGYQRGPTPSSQTPIRVQRRSALEKVENWVKVQKEERQGFVSTDGTIPRQTPSIHPKYGTIDKYQSLPKTVRQSPPTAHRQLSSEYKYSHDRLNHFQMTHGHSQRPATHDKTVWQLYEWQQRQQYRHGSPTAPVYTPAPDYSTAVSSTRVNSGVARSISVPPTLADIPPPGPPGPRLLSLRRPHTPAERVTVKPLEDRPTVEVPPSNSPHHRRSYKSATIERRSMPPSGYITHTVSAPSLHGKTPEELTLLLIQLRRHQAMMAGVRNNALAHLRQLSRVKADDTYMDLKKDLEYLDLKMKSLEPLIFMAHSVLQTCTAGGLRPLWNVSGTETLKGRPAKPVKVAESDVDVTLSRLCEQDKILQELEFRLSGLKDDKDKLESVLDVSHQQMEQYKDQPAHAEKIAYQQRLLQEDLVHIRADISRVSTEMERAWEDYSRLEQSVEQLRDVLQTQMNLCTSPQEKNQLRRELWRIEDVITGLSSSKETFKITIDSVKNPERKLVPSVIESTVPSWCMTPSAVEVRSPQRSLTSSPLSLQMYIEDLLHTHSVPKCEEDDAPPRPPLPLLYDEDTPPVVPPLPKETSVIRHTSVRGLKRQSDERKRDRESSYVNGDYRVELRSYLSEPELPGAGTDQVDAGYLTLQRRGLSGSSSRINQYGVTSCSLRRGDSTTERPKSALERLCSVESQPDHPPQRGRMSVEEQLERMKRHQRALVRERKRNLSQGERQPVGSRTSTRPVSSDPGSEWEKVIDLQTLYDESQRPGSDEWLTVEARPMNAQELEPEVEPVNFDFDLTRELCTPQKVSIPERLMDVELDEDLSPEEKETRSRTVAKIKSLLSKSSGNSMDVEHTDFSELDEEQQQQERIMSIHRALATEASIKRKQVTAKAMSEC
ncbi:pleckstrin homology domain-containing family A member 7-like isoform X2 [Cyprinus carpio]|uniref:Pleckstrin homology domain-containing family A member 7-like isoform X2 n=1 Tax=Cyprinus carpio TaxID=7962 RepID=A0A9Q9XDJ8_CYPCA|nr:pleckstrin homology domain-containing family A member 7-like isoform X2 [Cyprinus carpio]